MKGKRKPADKSPVFGVDDILAFWMEISEVIMLKTSFTSLDPNFPDPQDYGFS